MAKINRNCLATAPNLHKSCTAGFMGCSSDPLLPLCCSLHSLAQLFAGPLGAVIRGRGASGQQMNSFSTARVAPEKHDTSACLPIGFHGLEGTIMDFDFGYGTVKFCAKPAPTVFFTFVNIGGIHAYQASQVIHAARSGQRFDVAPLFNDQPLMGIDADTTKRLADWIEGKTKPHGRFETLWVATDSSTPF